MMGSMDDYRSWYAKHADEIRDDYFQFLRFRSISTEPEFKEELLACANWVRDYLKNKCGFSSKLLETVGHPVVFGEKKGGSSKETVLIYGHYDVQPVDPLELWESDPFVPTIRNERVYARGAVDDKGQIFYAMAAMRAAHELGRTLPVNIKFCIEGEEEAGSIGLEQGIGKLKKELSADSLLVVDFNSFDETTPAIHLGMRGIMTMEVTLTGSNGDLHSGSLGGIAYNPNRALVELLAKLYREDGSVAVDGFYDGVEEPTADEKSTYVAKYAKDYYQQQFGIDVFGGEKGRSIQEANLFRPVLEINGIGGGYSGAGFKTVIPAKATAKISCRLVPGQDPKKVAERIKTFLMRHSKMKTEVHIHSGAPAYRGKAHSKLSQAIQKAATEVCRKPCRIALSGASIPIVSTLATELGVEMVGMGYCLATDQIHAPNEHFDLQRFEKGFMTVALGIENL
jgi:acetylornithine deacetylase/succinyl-diaminopimelate desuccinylase-like protein